MCAASGHVDLARGAPRCLPHRPPPASAGHVFTGGWDGQLCRWDPRASEANAGAVSLPDKALTMDTDGKQCAEAVSPSL